MTSPNAERFNARDFDVLREILGQEFRLGLVARRKPIQGRGGEYFTNYAKTRGLVMTPINVEGRPGLRVDTEAEEGAGAPGYVVVLEFGEGKVVGISDFRYARWVRDTRKAPAGIGMQS